MSTVPVIIIARHSKVCALAIDLISNMVLMVVPIRGEDPRLAEMGVAEEMKKWSEKVHREEILNVGPRVLRPSRFVVRLFIENSDSANLYRN